MNFIKILSEKNGADVLFMYENFKSDTFSK